MSCQQTLARVLLAAGQTKEAERLIQKLLAISRAHGFAHQQAQLEQLRQVH